MSFGNWKPDNFFINSQVKESGIKNANYCLTPLERSENYILLCLILSKIDWYFWSRSKAFKIMCYSVLGLLGSF